MGHESTLSSMKWLRRLFRAWLVIPCELCGKPKGTTKGCPDCDKLNREAQGYSF